ncbi:DUF202 domain-containing protein [Nocardia donostiensis]|uniref:DUF202 domain-containing protein n=1 Tax=Nocardia donostiensis TaxID=1538463 RepID=A0A1W0AX42_9NOCA|nr:DUF202 domain-containing protein [Nocardia donostiensis]ONM49357.1 hypothetical protein B0T46_08330 [Nocardia donostiensis]OQS14877.1 hypothetical protein B0T36_12590 [Nocardia donostiensis]OQS21880.1 hypothetical protein B0T44_07285 [Nocardia donostiensis]
MSGTGPPTQRTLAVERTVLAWRRTAVAAMLVALLLGSSALRRGGDPTVLASIAPIAAAMTMLTVVAAGYLRSRGLRHGQHPPRLSVIAVTSAAVVFTAAAGFAVAVVGPG